MLFLASSFRDSGPTSRAVTDTNLARSPGSFAICLTERCHLLLMQGLAPLTHCVDLSAQHRYVSFCRQDGHVGQDGALLPADEQALMCFATSLSDSLHHSFIKVHLNAVCSLPIDLGLPDPLVNCLQLQHLLRGIKRVQGSSPTKRLPITIDILRVIQGSLDLTPVVQRVDSTIHWIIL